MPVGPGGANTSGTQPRQTFRPPWVKDDPPPVPMPTQPWVKSNKSTPAAVPENKQENHPPFGKVNLRKVSEIPVQKPAAPTPAPQVQLNKVSVNQSKENGAPSRPGSELKTRPPPVAEPNKTKPAPGPDSKMKPSPNLGPQKKVSEVPPKPAVTPEPVKKNPAPPTKAPAQEPVKKAAEPAQKPPVPMYRRTSEINIPIEAAKTPNAKEPAKVPEPPKPPPSGMPPAPPAPPPPPPQPGQQPLVKSVMTPEKKQKLDMLRSRPKKRPDWGNMMKEIETGRKLNHVQCNDRSSPLLPKVKAKGQFVYESERPNLHNQLLKQIETGIKLKPVRTNDRSKPFIEGLRKFRRQMTIEEQIQKSASMASLGIVEPEPDPLDEVDDIDKVRDDLQSTKQLLAMELKNKEALERENKKLAAKVLNLEVEIEKEKNKSNKEATGGTNATTNELQKEIEALRAEAKKAKDLAEEMENKYHNIQGQYDLLKLDLEESVQKNQRLEKQLKVAQAANLANHGGQPLTKQPSKKVVHQNKVCEAPITPESPEESEEEEEEETETETETESEDNGANEEAQKEKRLLRELKLLTTKLQSFKNKKEAAKKERKTLKEQMSKLQKAIKDEKKNYKVLQKEVDKMSKLMTEDDDDEEEEEEEEEPEEEEESSEEEDEESEESESEESEGDLPESAPPEKKKINLQGRTKKYENVLSSLKKGNYLLKANLDRYKDELNKQKEMSFNLQEDLNSVLAELG